MRVPSLHPALDGLSVSENIDGDWLRLTPDRSDLGRRYIQIMCGMNRPSYQTARPDKIIRVMSKPPCEYFYRRDEEFELVCGFRWFKRLGRFQLMSTGFAGKVAIDRAVDLVIAKICAFMREKAVDRIVAIRPHVMEHPGILQAYRLAASHSRLQFRGTHRLRGGTYLWIQLVH